MKQEAQHYVLPVDRYQRKFSPENSMNSHLGKEATQLLLLLLLTDFVFILLHWIHKMKILVDPLFSVAEDFGYAEVFQYIKEFWIVILLLLIVRVAKKKNKFVYFSWATFFMFLLLDDSLKIHERLGRHLSNYFGFQPMFYLRAKDYGELSVSIIFGLLLFALIGVSYLFSDQIAKEISKYLLTLVLCLVFFGVFLDMLHSAISWGERTLGLIEDGGEMIVMSIIVWYVFGLKKVGRKKVGRKKDQRMHLYKKLQL